MEGAKVRKRNERWDRAEGESVAGVEKRKRVKGFVDVYGSDAF